MTRARRLVGALGLLGTLLALAFVLAPTSAASIRPVELVASALPTERPKTLLVGIGFVVGIAATVLSRSAGRDTSAPLVDVPPESVQATSVSPGREFDQRLARADADHDQLREVIRTTAIETLVQQAGFDPESAVGAVQHGTWTDDRVAAALLGTPTFPLRSRIRAWLDPDAERERRVRRAIEAIETLSGEGRS